VSKGKQRITGVVTLAVGIAAMLFQIKVLREKFYFYEIGMLCGALIVFGIAMMIMGTDGFIEKDENGEHEPFSFMDLPLRWKATMVLAVLGMIGMYAYFDSGAPGLL